MIESEPDRRRDREDAAAEAAAATQAAARRRNDAADGVFDYDEDDAEHDDDDGDGDVDGEARRRRRGGGGEGRFVGGVRRLGATDGLRGDGRRSWLLVIGGRDSRRNLLASCELLLPGATSCKVTPVYLTN